MPSTPQMQRQELPLEAILHLREGRMIEAVKAVRKARGIQLKEAKDMIDGYLKTQPALQQELAAKQAEARGILIKWVLIVCALGGFAYLLATA